MMHLFHKWSKWKTTLDATAERTSDGSYVRVIYQERRCLKCEKRELSRQVT